MRESKECVECGGIYFRDERVSARDWEQRRYCSRECVARVGRRAALAKKQEALEPPLVEEAVTEAAAVAQLPQKAPVMRELRIVRVGPNPRLVVCEYYELASRRLCRVLVRRTSKFVKGMRLVLAEPPEEMAYRRPWVYDGPLPRHRGRW